MFLTAVSVYLLSDCNCDTFTPFIDISSNSFLFSGIYLIYFPDRSLCSVVCKWTFNIDDKGNFGWNDEFWELIGLGDVVKENYRRFGKAQY